MKTFRPNIQGDSQPKLKNPSEDIILNNEFIKYNLNKQIKINRYNFK